MTLSPNLQSALVAGLRAALPGMCQRCAEGKPAKDGVDWIWYHHWIDARGDNCWARCVASVQRTLLARVEEETKGAEDAI